MEFAEGGYPRDLESLASFIRQPLLPLRLRQFLYQFNNPQSETLPMTVDDLPPFDGRVYVHHSAVASYYAPSDLCGTGGMHRERIRSTPTFHGAERRDTAFVVLDQDKPGMEGMVIAWIQLFFSFTYRRRQFSCAFVNWFVPVGRDEDTGMWVVKLERRRGLPTSQVIDVDTIARGAHLLPIFGSERVPEKFDHNHALDRYKKFFVNHFVDHHSHEFIAPY